MGLDDTVRLWRAFYEAKSATQTYLPETDAAETHRARMVRRVLGATPASILDVGCGDGYLCHIYHDELGIHEVAGLDIAQRRVDRARRLFPGISFLRGDVDELPFGEGAFDVVSAVEVLEHLERPDWALRELARVAARRVIVTVPFNEPSDIRLCPHCLKTFALDGHIQRFDRNRLGSLAKDAGLTPGRFVVYRPWEERHPFRKLYAPLKRLLYPDEFKTGGWLAMAADKPQPAKGA